MGNGEGILAGLRHLLAIDVPPTEMDFGQVIARALAIYVVGLAILRLGEHRFLGKSTAFDIVLGFILGSMLSRAVNGSAPLAATAIACAVLVALHWLFAVGSFRSNRFGSVVKGNPLQLVRNGEIDWDAMRRGRISVRDLEEAMRSGGKIDDFSRLGDVWFERSGELSVLPRKGEPRVVEVDVAEGVQTVRVVLE